MYASLRGIKSRRRSESIRVMGRLVRSCNTARLQHLVGWLEVERTLYDPKDRELYLHRVKPEEILVEARSGSDVQIDRQTWVKRRKTNRAV